MNCKIYPTVITAVEFHDSSTNQSGGSERVDFATVTCSRTLIAVIIYNHIIC